MKRLVFAVLGMRSFHSGEHWGSRNAWFPVGLVETKCAHTGAHEKSNLAYIVNRMGKVGTKDSALAKVGVVSSNLIARSKFPEILQQLTRISPRAAARRFLPGERLEEQNAEFSGHPRKCGAPVPVRPPGHFPNE